MTTGELRIFHPFSPVVTNRKIGFFRIKEHPAGGLICQYCGKDFTLKKHGPEDRSRINLIQHMRKHKYGTWGSQNIDKKCVCCGEHFTQQMRFSYHMKKFNPKYHNNACPICEGVRFDTYEEHKVSFSK